MIKNVLEAVKRILNHRSQKKLALTVEQLRLAAEFLNEKRSLKNIRMRVIMIISFAGFLRFSECQNLRRSDIKILNDYALIFIEKSKTDVYREGHWIMIAKTNSDLCPVSNLAYYLEKANIDALSDEFIFRRITNVRNQERLRSKNKPISYTSIRDHFIVVLKSIKLDAKLFGLHSLRSGGASAAANMGVPDRLIQKHGRWKTVGIKNRYISEDVDSILFISRNLGL